MRQLACAVLSAAVVLSAAAFGPQAQAMTIAPSSLRGAARADALPIQQIRNVCGLNGCAPVLVKRVQVPPRNFTTTAAPLVVSNAPAAAPARPLLPGLPSLPAPPWPLSLLQRK